MSASLSIEEKLDAVLKGNHDISVSIQELKSSNKQLKAQNEYLRKELGTFLKLKQKINKEPTRFDAREEAEASNPMSSSSEDEPPGRTRMKPRFQANSNDFRVEIPEFEGKLDPDEFLGWMHIVERVFAYEDNLDDKKVKLVVLRLRKYASLWWTNLCAKRLSCRENKIRTWEKMKAKLKSQFLPPSYV